MRRSTVFTISMLSGLTIAGCRMGQTPMGMGPGGASGLTEVKVNLPTIPDDKKTILNAYRLSIKPQDPTECLSPTNFAEVKDWADGQLKDLKVQQGCTYLIELDLGNKDAQNAFTSYFTNHPGTEKGFVLAKQEIAGKSKLEKPLRIVVQITEAGIGAGLESLGNSIVTDTQTDFDIDIQFEPGGSNPLLGDWNVPCSADGSLFVTKGLRLSPNGDLGAFRRVYTDAKCEQMIEERVAKGTFKDLGPLASAADTHQLDVVFSEIKMQAATADHAAALNGAAAAGCALTDWQASVIRNLTSEAKASPACKGRVGDLAAFDLLALRQGKLLVGDKAAADAGLSVDKRPASISEAPLSIYAK